MRASLRSISVVFGNIIATIVTDRPHEEDGELRDEIAQSSVAL
ncbi:MAG: hypothetical protein ABI883_01430 [Chthoniobacterales bacterium]